ncbi:MAG: DNA polymerase III subunit [Clostridia bacterium]|nr:DNA polymerase III subunit [Clostridia bacterium]
MAFETFFGNEVLKNTVWQRLKTGTLPHAIILEGERGLGKRTFARLIAAGLLCANENPPCGQCRACTNVLEKNHPDVLYYETEKHTKDNFKIDTVRDIRDIAYISPNQAAYKVFILAEADLMNTAAQNALLKILEEPPAYAVFILLCEKKSAFLETILSRCTVYKLERVDDETAFAAVRELLSGPTDEEIRKCIELVGGNIGMVLDGLRGNEALRANEKALEIAEALCSSYEFDLLKVLGDLEAPAAKGILAALAEPLKAVCRDAVALRCGGEALIKMNAPTAHRLAESFTKKQLFALEEVAEELGRRVDRNMNRKLLLTWLCAALRTAVEYE